MITLMRNAMSATMGTAVMPVSYTWRAIEIGRRRRGRTRPRSKIERRHPALDGGAVLGNPLAGQFELQALVGAPNLEAHAWPGAGRISAWRADAPRGTRDTCPCRARCP